jgi:hypothetical protein
MTCPHCHQDAPSIVRDGRAYCTACRAPRSIFTAGDAVNVAGQPARLGGGIASVLGWLALSLGLTISLGLGAVAYVLFAMTGALWIGGTVAVLTLLVALPLLFGGRRLSQAGEDRARAAQENAVFGLAARRRGVLSVREVAGALSVREDEADSLLTTLAKRPDGRVTLELDDNGGISYVFHDLRPTTPSRVRVPEQPWTVPVRATMPAASPRVIDAELIEEDDALARPAARHASR